MKFIIDTNHLEFFGKNHYIEFESLLSEQELLDINKQLPEALAAAIHLHKKVVSLTPENKFNLGRDLWRLNPLFNKLARKKPLAELAAQLIQRKHLRLGFDQFLPGIASTHAQTPYIRFLNSTKSLEEISSFQEILGGWIVCLKSSDLVSEVKSSFFPVKQGNGVFIDPKTPIAFSELLNYPNNQYLLITYLNPTPVYILNEHDPHTHFAKNFGYSYGDKLKEKDHPTLCR